MTHRVACMDVWAPAVRSPDVLHSMVRLGVRFVSAGIEWDFLMAGAHQRAIAVRAFPLE